jgi:plasmid stability protein
MSAKVPQESASRSMDKVMLRLPDDMRAAIKTDAAANNRSMNAEIVARLQQPDGMTLRDWFAGQALAGLLSDIDNLKMMAEANIGSPKRISDLLAEEAYRAADAMMAERSK